MKFKNITLCKVLAAVEMRARHSYRDIAAQVNISEQLVQYHCERAGEERQISGWNAIIDLSQLNQTFYLLYFRFFGLDAKKEERWIKQTQDSPGVSLIARTIGRWNATVGIVAPSPDILAANIQSITNSISHNVAELAVTTEIECTYTSLQLLAKQPLIMWRTSQQRQNRNLDELDRAILSVLANDCRTPASSIASDHDVAPSTIQRRIERLEQDNIILGYRALINYEALGFHQYRLLVKLSDLKTATIDRLRAFLAKSGRVQSISRYLGLADVDFRCHASSLEDLATFIGEIRDMFASEVLQIEIVPLFYWQRFNSFPQILK